MPPSHTEARLRDLTPAQRWAIAAIIVFAAAIRIGWNDVKEFSPADESVYSGYTRTLVASSFVGAYPEIVRAFESDARRWRYPSPVRWGYFAVASIAANVAGDAEPHTIASLSTVGGILVIPLVFLLALELFGANVALLAAAFSAVSCIELALGRRALQDEVFCLVVLASVFLFIRYLAEPSRRALVLLIAGLTLSFAVKESFVYAVPAFVALLLAYKKARELRLEHLLIFLAPPAINYACFSVLARDATAYFRVGRILASTMSAPYVVQYQSGPPHRLLFDFFITAPLVSILAAAAIVFTALTFSRPEHAHARALAVFIIVAAASFALIPKNLRFFVILDPFIRVLAAWVVASAAVTGRAAAAQLLAMVAIANGAIELEIFHTVFIVHGVYDPVTQSLLEALAAVPRDVASPAPQMLFPAICAALIAAWWLGFRKPPGRPSEPRRT